MEGLREDLGCRSGATLELDVGLLDCKVASGQGQPDPALLAGCEPDSSQLQIRQDIRQRGLRLDPGALCSVEAGLGLLVVTEP